MTTDIHDRYGKRAPTVTVTEIRRRPGKFWKLVDRRGVVGINWDGETLAVALSLDQFVSLLFGIPPGNPRKKHKSRGKSRTRSNKRP